MPLEISKLSKRAPFERIAFFGPMVSGKTFLAHHLVMSYDYQKVALADKLKSVAYDLFGVSGKDGSTRKLLQEFSDDIKKWDPDVFIKHFLIRVKNLELMTPPPRIVCDDLRFKREGTIFKKAGFTLIKVECSPEIREARLKSLYPNTDPSVHAHKSENEFDSIPFDFVLKSEYVSDIFSLDSLVSEYD